MDLLHYSTVQALQVIRSGGIILYPTDTVWGIGCDATNEEAIERIYRLKQREDSKSLIILVASEQDIFKYVDQPDPSLFEYLKTMSQPTTVIYEAAINLPVNLINYDGSIAIRVVKEIFCKELIEKLGRPIVSTSANISGGPAPKTFSAISEEIMIGVDYVVDYRQEDKSPAVPSRIIKMKKNGLIEVIRE